MGELIKYINRFEIITYCFQGIIFIYYLACNDVLKKFLPQNIIYTIILSYLIGFILSRIGSLIFERFLSRKLDKSNLRYIPITTSKDDMISELNTNKIFIRNLFTTLFFVLVIDSIFNIVFFKSVIHFFVEMGIIVVLIILYLSYKKNFKYLIKRINFLLSTLDNNKVLVKPQLENKYYTICPYCQNKNTVGNKCLKFEICYKCGSRYDIDYK